MSRLAHPHRTFSLTLSVFSLSAIHTHTQCETTKRPFTAVTHSRLAPAVIHRLGLSPQHICRHSRSPDPRWFSCRSSLPHSLPRRTATAGRRPPLPPALSRTADVASCTEIPLSPCFPLFSRLKTKQQQQAVAAAVPPRTRHRLRGLATSPFFSFRFPPSTSIPSVSHHPSPVLSFFFIHTHTHTHTPSTATAQRQHPPPTPRVVGQQAADTASSLFALFSLWSLSRVCVVCVMCGVSARKGGGG